MKKYIISFFIFFITGSVAISGENPDKKISPLEFRMLFLNEKITFQPNTFQESLNFSSQTQDHKKSLLLAGIFSAVVPGAGEFYSESYLKSALFFVAEAASWIVNVKYNKKGDNQTTFFQNYADAHWSVLKYSQWIQRNLDNFVTDQTYQAQCQALFQKLYKTTASTNPWDKVDFSTLNDIERIIGVYGIPDNGFSHALPWYGQQQYYELIGKYPQFRQGWDQADPNDNVPYINKDSLFTQFKWYSAERGKANDYYNVASTFASIIVVNHVVSALDAVLSAYLYNKAHISVTYQTIIQPDGFMSVNPYLNIQISF